MVSQHQECSLQAALTPNVKGERVLLTVDIATICAQDYFLSFREYMHAHAGKTDDKQHGSNTGVNDTTSQQALSSYASLKEERFHRCVTTLPFINDAQELQYQSHQLPLDFN